MIHSARTGNARFALVAGGWSGVANAMAERLARAGYNLILASDRDMDLTLTQAEFAVEFPDLSVETFSADLGAPGAAQRLYEAVSRRRPRVDVLVCDSWTGDKDMSGGRSLSAQLRAIRINVEALTVLTQQIAADMEANGEGRILTMSFVQQAANDLAVPVYRASGAFIEEYSRELNEQMKATGVTVTCLRTPIPSNAWHTRRSSAALTEERDLDEIAAIAFDGMLRGDALVALDGSHRTPLHAHRAIALTGDNRPVVSLS